jgi:hypothetical protein
MYNQYHFDDLQWLKSSMKLEISESFQQHETRNQMKPEVLWTEMGGEVPNSIVLVTYPVVVCSEVSIVLVPAKITDNSESVSC